MKHFKIDEFDCQCCGANLMDSDFLDKIDLARDIAHFPFYINSGFRCKSHNKDEGGSAVSSHLMGLACDIKCVGSMSRFKILRGLMLAGVNRIGIRKDFIHADNDPEKDPCVTWLY